MDSSKHFDKKPKCGQDSHILKGLMTPGGHAGFGKPAVAGTDSMAPESRQDPAVKVTVKSSAHDD